MVREGMGSEHTSISRRTSRPLIASTFFATRERAAQADLWDLQLRLKYFRGSEVEESFFFAIFQTRCIKSVHQLQ